MARKNGHPRKAAVYNPMFEATGSDEDSGGEDTEKVLQAPTGPDSHVATQESRRAEGNGLEEEELADLTFAFEACDLDSGGTIDAGELLTVLKVFGVAEDFSIHQVEELIAATKKGFRSQNSTAKNGRGLKFMRRMNKQGKDLTVKSPSDELNLPEFICMMTSESAQRCFPNGWSEGAYHMRLLKNAYSTADTNHDNELTFEELAIAINSLHTGNLTDEDIITMWALLTDRDDAKQSLTFKDFLDGMVRVQNDKYMQDHFFLFSPDQLMSMVLDTPVSAKEEKDLLAKLSIMEQIGMRVLDNAAEEASEEKQQILLKRAQDKELHICTPGQTTMLNKLHHYNVMVCCAAGTISAVICAIVENVLTHHMHTDGAFNTDACCTGPDNTLGTDDDSCNLCDHDLQWSNPIWGDALNFPGHHGCELGYYNCQASWCASDNETICTVENGTAACDANRCAATPHNDTLFFALCLGTTLGICVGWELATMYYMSIKNCARVANALDLKLKPLNRDRAFAASSLVRAALELGNSNDIVFGVDPLREHTSGNTAAMLMLTVLYTAKIALSGFVIKVAIKRMAARGSAKYAMPWAAVPATAIWDS